MSDELIYTEVTLRDTRTGYSRTFCEWYSNPEFMFEDGNFGCDCNRSIVLYPDDATKELPCSEGLIELTALRQLAVKP